MSFRASFCDPLNPQIIEIGPVSCDRVMELFDSTPWTEHLEKMKSAKEPDIHYSPSLEVENLENKNGLSISAIDGKEWYVFFKRPKQFKRLFGLWEGTNDNYLSEVYGQSEDDVRKCLMALIRNDLDYLENYVK